MSSEKTMQELLALEDAQLYGILAKGDGHRGRDAERYGFMQDNIEEYAQSMKRRYMQLVHVSRSHNQSPDAE